MRHACICTLLGLLTAGAVTTVSAQTFDPSTPLNANAATDTGGDTFPQMATDGLGTWVAVWRSNDPLGGPAGTDWDIFFARSVDDGATWSAPAVLNSYGIGDSGIDHSPQVVTDGAGSWVAIWASWENVGGVLGADNDILVSRSTNAGVSWTAAQALDPNAATDTGHDYSPELTTDGAGNWVAVWRSSDFAGGPLGSDNDVLTSRSTNAGLSWSAPAAINTYMATDTGSDLHAQVTTDGSGSWVAVWSSGESFGGALGIDQDLLASRSTDGGATWTAATLVHTNAGGDAGNDMNPQLTTDGAGLWVVVWQSDEPLAGTGSDNDIWLAGSTDAGFSWSTPVPVNTNATGDSGSDEFPQLTTDGAGAWVAVWQSTDTLGATVDADEDVLWARSADGGASWNTPAAIDANATSDVGQDFWPQLITDGAGRWIAMWYSYDSFGGTIDVDADVIISRGTTSTPALPAFGALGLVGLVLALLGTGARRATRAPRPKALP